MYSRYLIRLSLLTAVLLLLAAASPALAQAPGSLDVLDANIVGSWVHATAVQPDGKVVISGGFTSVLGVPRNNIARLNTDGSLDMGFDLNTNGEVNSVAVQADGKILLGGLFTTLQPNGAPSPTTRNRIARVNADGSLDVTFNPKANGRVFSVTLQTDQKILLGGYFTTLQPNGAASPTTRNRVARLNADGNLDTGFDPNADGGVRSVAEQTDGKILLGGEFTTLQPNGAATTTARSYVARVNDDGSLDTGFDPQANDWVFSAAVQPDGKILLGGWFTTLQPNGAASATVRNRIARVNSDGSLDTGFDPKASNAVYNLSIQTDGKILFGGEFATLQPNGAAVTTARSKIARVNADGSLDTGFDPKANSVVYNVAVQPDGKILLGGQFTTLQPNGAASATPRNLFARLNNDSATQTLNAPSQIQVEWQRGGAAPEVSQVTFEQSINGGTTWTALGNGTRVGTTANWQLTGLSLPTSGQLRARGRTTNGYENGGSGLVETVVSFSFPDIAVEHPVGTSVVDGVTTIAFSTTPVGNSSVTQSFTITNIGAAELSGLAVSKDGTNPSDFSVSALSNTSIPVGAGTATFTVTFIPGGTTSTTRTAAIHIASNAGGTKNPFDIALTGQALSFTQDTDGDGMNDASEFQMALQGFDWQVSQIPLVNNYYANANGAGLYTSAQVQALNVGIPLIQRNPTTGVFTLTIGVEKSTNLSTFNPFPMTAPQTLINGQGKLEFQFTVPDNAAFFLLKAN